MTASEWREKARPDWLTREFVESAVLGATICAVLVIGLRSEDTRGEVRFLRPQVVEANQGLCKVDNRPACVRACEGLEEVSNVICRVPRGGEARPQTQGIPLPGGGPNRPPNRICHPPHRPDLHLICPTRQEKPQARS